MDGWVEKEMKGNWGLESSSTNSHTCMYFWDWIEDVGCAATGHTHLPYDSSFHVTRERRMK